MLKRIDRFRKNCLWRGNEINARKPPKAAWKMVCKSKQEGGLGIINIEEQNKALLMKNLDKFFNRKDVPWVQMIWEKHYNNGKLPGQTRKGSFWWRDNLKLLQQYKELACPNLKNGESLLFWKDKWNGQELQLAMPELYSFAKNQLTSVKKVFNTADQTQLFHLPLSAQAFQQFQQLTPLLQDSPQNQEPDVWKYSWGEQYSSTKAYKLLMGHTQIHDAYKWLWKSQCQPKHKVFFWLLISDRLSTRNMLRRKNMELESYDCVFCVNSTEETVQHLFLQCPFAAQCWQNIQIEAPGNTLFPETVSQIKEQMQSQFFMATIILMCWSIWKARNNLIFEGVQPSIMAVKLDFKKEMSLLLHRVKERLHINLQDWILSLL